MFKVIETFSGVGAQAKALENIKANYEIIHTADWDINAIIAYCLIHKKQINTDKYRNISDDEIDEFLRNKSLSSDGKKPMSERAYLNLKPSVKRKLYAAIKETNNLVSITDIKGDDIPNDIDLFTYSFPCQDLSLCGCWHGNKSGIARDAHNRSGMLWEVERILKEMHKKKKTLPRFLVMENVTNILSKPHEEDFNDWKSTLEKLGYKNKIYRLNARYFGVPQNRPRAYMISVRCDNKKRIEKRVDAYFENHNLEDVSYSTRNRRRNLSLKDILKVDYSLEKYKIEADLCKPNDTVSRRKIYEDNDHLVIYNEVQDIIVNTVTTKQDRNPNSGVIDYKNYARGKAKWRYLTPRECLMLMGFDEEDYDNIIEGNIALSKNRNLFTIEKLIKLAGNSIVVDVLEAIFTQILEINKTIFNKE